MTALKYLVCLVCPHCQNEIEVYPATQQQTRILLRQQLTPSMQKQGGKKGGEREREEANDHA